VCDEPPQRPADADADLEREIRKERKFSLAEASGRLAGIRTVRLGVRPDGKPVRRSRCQPGAPDRPPWRSRQILGYEAERARTQARAKVNPADCQPGGFRFVPHLLAVDAQGSLYLADVPNRMVHKLERHPVKP
jgi:hypothetical protein